MTYQGKNGTVYQTLEPPVGKGGEGSVYRIQGKPDYVLKVFAPGKRTEERHRKLLVMISSPVPSNVQAQVTWPLDVVYENGAFAGYVMHEVSNGKSLDEFYTDSDLSTFNLKRNIMIAKNLCCAVNAVHQAGHVCGDLNPKNISVNPQSGRVTLLDTDSYHIRDTVSGAVYRCTVGRPEYLAPEIQKKLVNGVTLETAPLPTFTRNTDNFTLAVLIFTLLMNGCHPFAAAVEKTDVSVTAPQPAENIRNGFCPFYQKKDGYTIPRYAPGVDSLPLKIRMAMSTAIAVYDNDARLNAESWYRYLDEMEKNLRKCPSSVFHSYAGEFSHCPYCSKSFNPFQPKMFTPGRQGMPKTTGNSGTSGVPGGGSTSAGSGHRAYRRPRRKNTFGQICLTAALLFLLCVLGSAFHIEDRLENLFHGKPQKKEAVIEDVVIDVPYLDRTGISYLEEEPSDASVSEESRKMISLPGITYLQDRMTFDGQKNIYSFTAREDGRFRFEVAGMSGGKIILSLSEEDGTEIFSDECCTEGEGITAKGLKKGTTYELKVEQYEQLCDYCLMLGAPKNTLTVGRANIIQDEMEFTDQRNVYYFIPETENPLTVTVSGMEEDMAVELHVFDEEKNSLTENTYAGNGSSISVRKLTPGRCYQIQARQNRNQGQYTLTIR